MLYLGKNKIEISCNWVHNSGLVFPLSYPACWDVPAPCLKQINSLILSSDLDTSKANHITLTIWLTLLWHLVQATCSVWLCILAVLALCIEGSLKLNYLIFSIQYGLVQFVLTCSEVVQMKLCATRCGHIYSAIKYGKMYGVTPSKGKCILGYTLKYVVCYGIIAIDILNDFFARKKKA